MFGKKTEKPEPISPISPQDQLEAELAQQLQDLTADTAEDRREDAADKMADAELDSARNASGQLINDPDARADAAPDDIERALARLRKAKDLKVKTSTTLAVGRLKRGDLSARSAELGLRGHVLAQDRARLAHRAIVQQKLRAALELEALEAQEHRIVAEAPDGTGLVPCTFVRGIFRPVVTGLGPDCPKAVFRHDVLPAIGAAYPDLLTEALPAEASAIFAAIERDCAKGVIRFAATAVDWQPAGGWHQGRITADELKSYLCGRLRREHHDL